MGDPLAPDEIAFQMETLTECDSKWTLFPGEWTPCTGTNALPCEPDPAEWLLRNLAMNLFIQTGAWLVSRELTEAIPTTCGVVRLHVTPLYPPCRAAPPVVRALYPSPATHA